MDWSTIFPYAVLLSILLFGIGIYALITCKKFLRAIYSIEILLMAANTLLLSFGLGFSEGEFNPDPVAQVFSIFIIIISIVFLIIGLALSRKLEQLGDSTLLEFNFNIEGVEKQSITEKSESTKGVNE